MDIHIIIKLIKSRNLTLGGSFPSNLFSFIGVISYGVLKFMLGLKLQPITFLLSFEKEKMRRDILIKTHIKNILDIYFIIKTIHPH